MVDHKIGSLPIVRGKQLVGINMETDIFKSMAEALGGRAKGVRVVLEVPNQKGVLAKLASKIAELGGNIISLAVFLSGDVQQREITLKVQDVNRDAVVKAIEGSSAKVMDVREITAEYQPQFISSN